MAQSETAFPALPASHPEIVESRGRITAIKGGVIFARLPDAAIGDVCDIRRNGALITQGRIISFSDDLFVISPFDSPASLSPHCCVVHRSSVYDLALPEDLDGSILGARGEAMDGRHRYRYRRANSQNTPPKYLDRKPVCEKAKTGIPAIDYLVPIGIGQRMVLIAPASTGKSTLLSEIVKRATGFSAIVVALVGERGKEVNDFISESFSKNTIATKTLVVSTSDESAQRRALAPFTATTIAERLRDDGEDVLLIIDSLTRAARAIRDMSLAAGELPVRQGYTSSVFSELPRLIERAGKTAVGSITAIYSLLEEEGSQNAITEEIVSLTDGHWILSPELARRGIYPALDLSRSISRCRGDICPAEDIAVQSRVADILFRAARDRDLLFIGRSTKAIEELLGQEELILDFICKTSTEMAAIRYRALADAL